ncbi:MAG: PAS domain-containing protein [Bacteroidia bacterium]|nr:PAS domain-containing protein [Bacteroidia bacterium]
MSNPSSIEDLKKEKEELLNRVADLMRENNDLRNKIANQPTAPENPGDMWHYPHSLIDSVPLVIYQVKLNDNRDVIHLNHHIETITGHPRSSFVGSKRLRYSDLIHEADRERVREIYNSVSVENRSFEVEYRLINKNGREIWIDEQGKVNVAEDGEVYLNGFILDITERKALSEKLILSKNRFQNLLTFAPYPVAVTNGDFVIEHINEQFEALLGYQVGEVLNRPIKEFINTEGAKSPYNPVELFHDNKKRYRIETTASTKDGNEIPVEIGLSNVDSQGDFLTTFTIIDLTHRRKIEHNIQVNEERLNIAMKAGNVGIWDWNVKANELVWDPSMFRLYGINSADFEGAYDAWEKTLHPDDKERASKAVEEAMLGIKEFDIQFRVITGNKEVKYVHAMGNVIRDKHGRAERMVGVNYDITKEKLAYEQLRLNERSLNSFFEMAPIGIARNDMDGNFIEINEEFVRFTGYSKEELNKLSYWDLTPKEYEGQEEIQLESLRTIGAYGPYEKEYIHKQGYRYPVLLNGRIIQDARGEDFIWSLVQDMSQVKEVDNLLRKGEERLKLALRAGRLGIFDLNLENGSMVWDEGQFEIFEMDPEDFTEHISQWENLLHPDNKEEILRQYEEILEGAEYFDLEFKILTPTGKTKYIHALGHLHFDESGKPNRIVGTNTDITIRVEAAKLRDVFTEELEEKVMERTNELKSTQLELQNQVDTLNQAALVAILDIDGKIKYVNDLFCLTTGFAEGEVLEGDFRVVLPDPESPSVMEAYERAEMGKMWFGELVLISKLDHREEVVVQTTVVPFQNVDGKVEKYVIAFIDITPIKELQLKLGEALEQEKKLNHLKSQFVSMASHQFRTPLAVIQSNSELFSMLTKDLNPSINSIVIKADKRIQKEVKRMTNMMNDVLILGKISSEDLVVKYDVVNVEELCRSIIQTYYKLDTKGREIELVIEGNAKEVNLAEGYIRHAIDNLVSNATKYSSETSPRIKLDYGKDSLQIFVEDDGIGIPPDEMDRVFEPFHRASNIGEILGTGLGLVIAKEYVEMNNGTISVESTLGKGTTFTITLPYDNTNVESPTLITDQ